MDPQTRDLLDDVMSLISKLQAEIGGIRQMLIDKNAVSELELDNYIEKYRLEARPDPRVDAIRNALKRALEQGEQ